MLFFSLGSGQQVLGCKEAGPKAREQKDKGTGSEVKTDIESGRDQILGLSFNKNKDNQKIHYQYDKLPSHHSSSTLGFLN